VIRGGGALFAALLLLSLPARALNGIASLGYATGGSQLADVDNSRSEYSLHAGQGYYLAFGVLFPLVPVTAGDRFDVQLEAGALFQADGGAGQGRSGDKGENIIEWSRFPLTALYLYENRDWNWRAGWGMTYNIGNSLRGKGSRSDVAIHPSNALGWVAAADKIFLKNLALGVRYTWLDFKADQFSRSVNADNLMLTCTYIGEL
jgi:hypothetical protein